MLYTPSGSQVNEYMAQSPYRDQAPQIRLPEYSPGGGRQYDSSQAPGLGRKSPTQIAASLAWMNTYPFIIGMIALFGIAVLAGTPESALVLVYALIPLAIRYFWRYFRYSAQTAQLYALG